MPCGAPGWYRRHSPSTFVEMQRVVADLLDAAGYPVPVLRPHHGERLEHHQVQGALEHIGPASSYGHRIGDSREAPPAVNHASMTGSATDGLGPWS